MTGVVILGAGSHGRDLECLLTNEVRFLDDADPVYFPTHYPLPEGWLYAIGVWDPKVRASLDRPDDEAAFIQSSSATVGQNCTVMEGCVIGMGAVLSNDVSLGRHVHVGNLASLVRCRVGDFSTISNGATICGDVTIGARVIIGANAVVKNLVTIGDDAVIGCGTVVVHDVEPGTTVVGEGRVIL